MENVTVLSTTRGRRSVALMAAMALVLGLLATMAQTRVAGAATGIDEVIGLTRTNALVRFAAADPGTILSTTPVTGLQAGESLLGIDFRPATGQLLGLGSTSRLYVVSVATGAATVVGAPFAPRTLRHHRRLRRQPHGRPGPGGK